MRFSLQSNACRLSGRFFASPQDGCHMQGGQDGDADSAPTAPLAGETQSCGWGIAFPMPMGVWGR